MAPGLSTGGADPLSGTRSGTVAVVGEAALVEPYALAGARVLPAGTPEEVRAVWRDLADDVLVVLLTPAARDALGEPADGPMTAVLP
ncbi:MAG: V-type ATP synthase subunit F [Actinomycetales bacterium]|nr:V-type ATP synthase subunit F [Actinomycetales bacterium]